MKKRLQGLITGVIAGTIITGSIGVLATQYTATDNPFPIIYNGNQVSLQGYNIDGSTYFKLRDIANIVGGFSVGFYNNAITLTDNNFMFNSTLLTPYYGYYCNEYEQKDGTFFSMGGNRYSDGIVLDCYEAYALYNLGSKYSKFNFVIGPVSEEDSYNCGYSCYNNTSIQFVLDGDIIKTLNIHPDDIPQNISLPVKNGKQLKIQRLKDDSGRDAIGLGNITVE